FKRLLLASVQRPRRSTPLPYTTLFRSVQVFTREGIQRDKRAQQIIDDELKRFRLDLNDQLRIVEADAFDRIRKLLVGKAANGGPDRKSTRLNSSHVKISYAVFCLKIKT